MTQSNAYVALFTYERPPLCVLIWVSLPAGAYCLHEFAKYRSGDDLCGQNQCTLQVHLFVRINVSLEAFLGDMLDFVFLWDVCMI